MYKQINMFPKYEIDTNGNIRDTATRESITSTPDRYGHLTVMLQLANRKQRFKRMRVVILMLLTYDPPKYEKGYHWLGINYLDGNKANVTLDNLEWDLSIYLSDAVRSFARICNAFVSIPGFPGYEINYTGTVKDAKTGEIRRQTLGGNGYYYVAIFDPVAKKQCSVAVHRLMALTFIDHPKDTTLLVVNHKDGCITRNDPDNLEWVTHSENSRHAAKEKLANESLPVLVMKITTREVREYFSSGEFSRVVGVPDKALWWRLKNRTEIRPYHGYFIKYKDDKRPWPDKGATFKKAQHIGDAVSIEDTHTGEILSFKSFAQAGKFFGKNHKSMAHQANKPEPTLYLGRYLIRKVPE